MKLYGGIDLHSNNSVMVLIDEQDHVLYQKRLPNDLGLILRAAVKAIENSSKGLSWNRPTTGTGWSMG